MAEQHRYTQMQVKRRKEVTRKEGGEDKTYIRFLGVLRYSEPNPEYLEKPEGTDARTSLQKRKTVWREVTKTLEAEKVTKGRKSSQKKQEETEANIRAALEAWRDEVEAQDSRSESNADEVLLLEYMRTYVDDREAAGIIEKSTAADYRHTIVRLEKRFADTKLAELTADMVQRFQTDELKRGVSATTCGKVHRLLKQVLTYAVRHETIEKNVMLVVEPPKRPKKNPNGLDVTEAQRVTGILIDMQPTPVCVAAFLALHASLRAGEACGLTWADVDLSANTIRISRSVGLAAGGAYVKHTKNDSSTRTVDITADLAQKLTQRREYMREELKRNDIVMSSQQFGELYVCGTIDGRFLNPQILTRKWAAVAEAYNIIGTEGKRATFHTLRHGFATVGIASGVDVASIAAQMGHATVSQTLNTYTSATAEGKRRAAATIGEAMRPREEAQVLDFSAKTGTEG